MPGVGLGGAAVQHPEGITMHAHRFAITLSRTTQLAGAALTLMLATSAFAASRCDAPTTYVDRTACEKAKQSPESLRRYVERTRMLYELYYWDYITPEQVDRFYGGAQP